LRVVFLGSGAFAIPAFEALIGAGHDVAALVTQPDREKGRGRALAPPPLKPVAEARGVPIHQPRRIREPAAQETLRGLAPDIQVVVAYGQILPRRVTGTCASHQRPLTTALERARAIALLPYTTETH